MNINSEYRKYKIAQLTDKKSDTIFDYYIKRVKKLDFYINQENSNKFFIGSSFKNIEVIYYSDTNKAFIDPNYSSKFINFNISKKFYIKNDDLFKALILVFKKIHKIDIKKFHIMSPSYFSVNTSSLLKYHSMIHKQKK